MKQQQVIVTSISHLQFHLSRVLARSSEMSVPIIITSRRRQTHVGLPVGLVTDQILKTFGPLGEGLGNCNADFPAEHKHVLEVSVSQLQFNLSRTLIKATKLNTPFGIRKRHERTHVFFPVTKEFLQVLGWSDQPLAALRNRTDSGETTFIPLRDGAVHGMAPGPRTGVTGGPSWRE